MTVTAAPPTALSPQRLARITGLLYVALAVFGMYSALTLDALHVPDDAAATVDNLMESRGLFGSSLVAWVLLAAADIAITATWYLLLRSASRTLALLTVAFRLAFAAMLATLLANLYQAFLLTDGEPVAGLDQQQARAMAWVAVDDFNTGFLAALIFFGMHVLLLGLVLYRSRYVPRLIGALLIAAGAGYIVDFPVRVLAPDQSGPIAAVVLALTLVAEPVLAIWLLVKGVKTAPTTE